MEINLRSGLTTEYLGKGNLTHKSRLAGKQTKHQAPTIWYMDRALSQNHKRIWGPTSRRPIKEERKLQIIIGLITKHTQFVEIHKWYSQSVYNEKLFW